LKDPRHVYILANFLLIFLAIGGGFIAVVSFMLLANLPDENLEQPNDLTRW
jgi:hypothetical protein